MDPATLIPEALPIPVDWGWFYAFLLLTFIVHLLFMNIMLGSSIIALVHHLQGTNGVIGGQGNCAVCHIEEMHYDFHHPNTEKF